MKVNQVKCWFLRRGETGVPGENLSEQRREPTNSTHIWCWVRELNLAHIGGRRVLSPLRYSCSLLIFLLVMLTNAGIFLRGLKLCRESRSQWVLLVSKKKIGGSHAFFRDNWASIWERMPYIALYFRALYKYCAWIIFEKCVVTPNFLFGCQ